MLRRDTSAGRLKAGKPTARQSLIHAHLFPIGHYPNSFRGNLTFFHPSAPCCHRNRPRLHDSIRARLPIA
ncbi:unnamed protein product [Protopolystoma xenopodis]|uniref:Uncharacterized protein n=1 Tax=Protopolystoma xenopodis TaxID=117903 RepID=A0A448WZK3_9PLAT|nr:unnamed protein product [Protopolystoma xenopodis]